MGPDSSRRPTNRGPALTASSIDSPCDKLVDIATAAQIVADGDIVALGGGLSHREPMALVRELIRQRRRDLHLIGSAHGIDVDLLVAAGCVSVVEESYVGFEQDFGLAPAYRRAAQERAIETRETCCYTMLQQLRAAEYGLPFMPVRGIAGTDIPSLHPEYRTVKNPYGDDWLFAVPPLAPDVALIHVTCADRLGNAVIPKPMVLDERFAHAGRKVVLSAETIVEPGEISPDEVIVPYFLVTAVTEAPFGAHPTSCYPNYTYDRVHIYEWTQQASTASGAQEYLDRWVRADGGEEGYRAGIGVNRLGALSQWSRGDARWQKLMT